MLSDFLSIYETIKWVRKSRMMQFRRKATRAQITVNENNRLSEGCQINHTYFVHTSLIKRWIHCPIWQINIAFDLDNFFDSAKYQKQIVIYLESVESSIRHYIEKSSISTLIYFIIHLGDLHIGDFKGQFTDDGKNKSSDVHFSSTATIFYASAPFFMLVGSQLTRLLVAVVEKNALATVKKTHGTKRKPLSHEWVFNVISRPTISYSHLWTGPNEREIPFFWLWLTSVSDH